MSKDEVYLRAILATVARQTFSLSDILSHVTPRSGSEKQVAAYNLCDGTRSIAQIASELKLDKSNLRKSINRWVDAGIVVKIEDGQEVHPVHVYPIPEAEAKKLGPTSNTANVTVANHKKSQLSPAKGK